MKTILGAATLAAGVALVSGAALAGGNPNQGLSDGDAAKIFGACKTAAKAAKSDKDLRGTSNATIMWCGVLNREGTTLLIRATDTGEAPGPNLRTDAWRASIEIALAKAFTAVSVSSDQNALDSKTVGALSQPGQALWGIGDTNPYRLGLGEKSLHPDDKEGVNHHGIVTFAGGQPVYDCKTKKLLGAVGVSGDSVSNDDTVAKAAVTGAGFGLDPKGAGCSAGPGPGPDHGPGPH